MGSIARRCGTAEWTTARPARGPNTGKNYYAAFVLDPDGYKLEAKHPPAPEG